MKKRVFAVLTALVLLCACLPLSVSAEKSGTTGDCTWTLDGTHLTISGEGEMGDYSRFSVLPWGRSITSVTIENGVTSIGESAFRGCDALTSVTIGDSVTSIGESAFRGCTSLTSVTIPDSVTSIGESAFRGCTSLTSVTIPDSVISIGGEAFSDTAYYNTSSNWENDLLYIGNHLVTAKKSLSSSCNIKNGTLTIREYAFSDCTSLTAVTIPDSVTTIWGGAFAGCTALTSVTIGDSVTSIEGLAFSGCTSLTSVTIGDSVTTIGGGAFSGCTSLTSITIPDSVTTIGGGAMGGAFAGCTSLTSVTIPDSVTTIGDGAFSRCTSLTDVYYGGNKTDRAIIAVASYNEPLQNATWHYEDADKDGKNNEEGQSAEGGFNGWMVVAVVSWITNAALLFLLLKKRKSAPKSE